VRDVQFARKCIPRIKQVAQFWQPKGNGDGGIDGGTHDFASVAVDAGGDIHADDGFGAGVDGFDDLLIHVLHRAG